mmetsp:Transcript_28620/g.66312  ORF Transcript_28620/g.66312 Transcript_28620/m.66312 type:complete len:206 (-) Transcript_28620:57-674(-)
MTATHLQTGGHILRQHLLMVLPQRCVPVRNPLCRLHVPQLNHLLATVLQAIDMISGSTGAVETLKSRMKQSLAKLLGIPRGTMIGNTLRDLLPRARASLLVEVNTGAAEAKTARQTHMQVMTTGKGQRRTGKVGVTKMAKDGMQAKMVPPLQASQAAPKVESLPRSGESMLAPRRLPALGRPRKLEPQPRQGAACGGRRQTHEPR